MFLNEWFLIHFLLTDQCTIQNITKLVFSITTLKFKIWFKFLWLTLHSNMFQTWLSILRELFSVLSWNCTYLLHTKLVPVSVWQRRCSYWCVRNPSVVRVSGCGCTCVDRPVVRKSLYLTTGWSTHVHPHPDTPTTDVLHTHQ
jgi:hypothetical protein